MKVSDVYHIIEELRTMKSYLQECFGDNPYHTAHKKSLEQVKNINKEIDRLKNLIYNIDVNDEEIFGDESWFKLINNKEVK